MLLENEFLESIRKNDYVKEWTSTSEFHIKLHFFYILMINEYYIIFFQGVVGKHMHKTLVN